MKRRLFLQMSAALPFLGASAEAATGSFEINRTEAAWRAMLTETEYLVMREDKTERSGSSPLDTEKRTGTYMCKGCDLPLYSSMAKFDSGTGWPSFYNNLPNSIGTEDDNTFFTTRTEAHCRRCGSHLGHIFEDGPDGPFFYF